MEIERKYLLKSDEWQDYADEGTPYIQGYIINNDGRNVRIRLAGEKGFITIKGSRNGISREEFEYEIPANDAKALITDFCNKPLITKHRYVVKHGGLSWEIDVFHEDNEGLIIAEVELDTEDQKIDLPDWIGKEVSFDKRYYNSRLITYPFTQWKD